MVIRATMAVPIVFTLLYYTGRLIIHLTEKLKKWWLMSIITAGIEQGIRDVAERRAKDMAKDIAKDMVEAEREEVKQFMRSKGVSDEDIDAFFRRVSNQD